MMIRVLITSADSYVGESGRRYLYPHTYYYDPAMSRMDFDYQLVGFFLYRRRAPMRSQRAARARWSYQLNGRGTSLTTSTSLMTGMVSIRTRYTVSRRSLYLYS